MRFGRGPPPPPADRMERLGVMAPLDSDAAEPIIARTMSATSIHHGHHRHDPPGTPEGRGML